LASEIRENPAKALIAVASKGLGNLQDIRVKIDSGPHKYQVSGVVILMSR
jgi:hypothetical protein